MADDPACDPNNPIHVKINEIQEAFKELEPIFTPTPCVKAHLSDQTNMDLYLKKEFLEFTGSFKERGARYTLMKMTPEKQKLGVIAASAGNHAQGVSYHGLQLGIPVTVVMPVTAPIMKIERCKKLKANVIVQGSGMGEAKAIALQMGKDQGLTYINGFDHPHVLAGAGSIGVELLQQVPNLDAVIVPVGGGGLLAGIASAVKSLSPHTKIIGAESENCPGMSKALEAGKPVEAPCLQSLADGLAVPVVGYNAFETARHYMDKMVQVKEEMVAIAILALMEQEKCVVEGAGATALAAILSGVLPELKGKRVCILLSGGNIDTSVLGRVMDRGLTVLGRLIKFQVRVSDKAGGISALLDKLASIGVSIRDIVHDRPWLINDIFSVNVTVNCECRNIDHAVELKQLLDNNYKDVDYTYFPNVCTAKALGL